MTAPEYPGPVCAAPGCPRGPRRGYLCGWHADRLGQTIADLAGDLTSDPAPPISGWRVGGGASGLLASERDPVNLRLIDAQTQAPPVLAAWATWLCEQRPGLTRPGGASGDRTLLARHLDWLIGQPEVLQFWVQIRALWASLRGHLPVRRCTCVDPNTGQRGPVWADRGGGWCSWCATAWSGRDLLELDRPEAAA